MLSKYMEEHDNSTDVDRCSQSATSIHRRYHTTRTALVSAFLSGFTNNEPTVLMFG